jgi:redox-sensitive bicupin YhaK (pirin superfamily)
MYAGVLEPKATLAQRIREGFGGYLFVVHGAVSVSSATEKGGLLEEGSAAMLVEEREISLRAGDAEAELLLVEVPPAP